MKSKPETSSEEANTVEEDYSEMTPKSHRPSLTPTQNVFAQQGRRVVKLLTELDEIALKEKQIHTFYTEEVAILDQIYCTEMTQYISRLNQSYEEGSCTHKRKTALGEIVLNTCHLLTDMNRETYEEAMKPYIYKHREIQQGISFKQQDREDIPEIAQALEAIYKVTLFREAHMAKDVESFLQTAYKKISIQLTKEEKEQLSAYKNSKMARQDWKRELNRHEGIRYAQIIQENISTQLFIKKSEAAKRAKIEELFREASKDCQKTGAFTLLRMQLNWIKESETGKIQLSDEKLAEYNKHVRKLLQTIEDEITRIITTPLANLPSEYALLLKIPYKKLPDKLNSLKAKAKKRLKDSLYLSECIDTQRAINQYLDVHIKDPELKINPVYRIEKE